MLKADVPIVDNVAGNVWFNITDIRIEQFLNALFPMLVTESGIVIVVKLVQVPDEPFPMLVTESGIVILIKLVQLLNAVSQMIVII